MWLFDKKNKKVDLDIGHKHHNAYWLLNEELKRMHEQMSSGMKYGGKDGTSSNATMFYARIGELQDKMKELIDKSPDADTNRRLTAVEETQIEQILLK